jgi:hypothetical protein
LEIQFQSQPQQVQVAPKPIAPSTQIPSQRPIIQQKTQQQRNQQLQRPVSVHGFDSFQACPAINLNSNQMSPLPPLQTNPPQMQSNPIRMVSGGPSPLGWKHVDAPCSPCSPGGTVNQQPKSFYNTSAPVQPSFDTIDSTSSFGQSPQVRVGYM